MRRIALAATLALTVLVGADPAPAPALDLPELNGLQWYNSPALGLKDLRGRAVLVEVFRTW